jgi:enoyl-CoA hydratase
MTDAGTPQTEAEPAVLVERDGHVVTVTINRPAKRNAFNAEVLCRLADAWDLIDGDDDIRAAILTGAGGDFSAGADLDRLVGAMLSGKPTENEFEERIKNDFTIIFKGFLKDYRTRKPLIAAIEGYCYAGGLEILQACDLRVAAEGASIALTEVQRGLFPMGGSSVRLTRQLPYAIAMEILLCGTPLTPEKALHYGLINYVVPDGGALAKARELADRLAQNGPLAVVGIKEAALAADALPEEEAFTREMEIGMAVMASEDAREGPRAFLEKRPANFTGK